MESARQKAITNVISFQLNVDIDIKDILIHFPLIEIMVIESTCLKVKYQDLYIIETEFKFIKNSQILLIEYKEFYKKN